MKLRAVVAAGAGAVGAAGLLARRARSHELQHTMGHPTWRPEAPGGRRLSVVVPAYREPRIGDTVVQVREALTGVAEGDDLEVIVVDDGSRDGTAERAEAAGADRVLRQPVNRGKGAAVRAGMLVATGRTVVFTDADLAYPPEQIVQLVEPVESGWDVVVGSRRHTGTTTLVRTGRLRELGGRAINLLTRAVLLGNHRDTQCGLKAFRSDVAQLLFSNSHVDGFAFDVEIFLLSERYGLSLREVPVRLINSPRSTVKVVRDAGRLVRDLFRIRTWLVTGVYDLPAGVPLPAGSADEGAQSAHK